MVLYGQTLDNIVSVMKHPKIIIQLVFYNDSVFLPGLAKSLKKQTFTDFHVLAIDNGAGQESAKMFGELFPDAELIQGVGNIGFGRAHNFLLKRTLQMRAPYVLVLNSDVELHKDFLKYMYLHMSRLPGVDACGPLIYYGKKKERSAIVQNYRLFMNFKTAKKHAPDSEKRIKSGKQLPVSADVDYLSGVAMMVRTEIFSDIHLFNERLFLYGEERDFFYRFSQQNRLAMVTRKAVVWHFHDWDTRNPKSLCREYYYLKRNKVLYFKEYRLRFGLIQFLLRETLSIPVTFIRAMRKKIPGLFYYYWLGILHGLKNKTGQTLEF